MWQLYICDIMYQLPRQVKNKALRVWQHVDAHQRIALFYLTINLPILGILFGGAFDQKIQHTFTLFVCSLTASILLAPHLLRHGRMNKLFCWMGALTVEERRAILCLEFRKVRRAPDYVDRIKPFIFRIGMCGIVLSLVGASPLAEDSYFSILCGAIAFYLFGVFMMIHASILIFAPTQK